MIVNEQIVYSNWTTLTRATLRMADGRLEERHVEHHGDAVAVLPYDPERRTLLLVSMPRTPVMRAGEANLLEAPAGRIDDESPEACGRREALEEAGVRLSTLEPVGRLWSMPALSTERLTLFLAPYTAADRIAAGGGAEDENEQIGVHEIGIDEVTALADAGALGDMKTLLLFQALRLRHPELFA